MKGYALILLAAALLLLLLPLPALPRDTATAAPPAESIVDVPADDSQTDTPQTTAPTTTAPTTPATPTQGEFKVLCTEQVIPLAERDFLIRTLAFEMSPTYHVEALKAQAVAAYTYYGRRRQAQKTQPDAALKGADFVTPAEDFPAACTPEKLQERWGENYTLYYDKICQAVDAVLGKTMTRDGELIDACYFAISNGCTESAEVVWGADIPYLQAVASPGDRLAPDYETTVTFTTDQVRSALETVEPTVSLPEDPATWFGTPTLSEAGTVTAIPVGDATLSGTKVRELLGLRSATFAVRYEKEAFTFTVKGYGHGVGMSQYGADYLARQGYTWQEILQYYYADVTIS